HSEVSKLFSDYVHQVAKLQQDDDQRLRIYADGRQRTSSGYEREVIEEDIREGWNTVTSNIFGAAGMYMAMRCYPDDIEMQNQAARLLGTLGETFFAAGEVDHAHHEYHHYLPADPFSPLYAPGKPDVHPSLAPVGHDLPGHATVNP